jgi:hypothetical protein
MEFLSNPIVYFAILALVFWGGAFSYYLGAGRIPRKLKPVTHGYVLVTIRNGSREPCGPHS